MLNLKDVNSFINVSTINCIMFIYPKPTGDSLYTPAIYEPYIYVLNPLH